MEANSKNTYEFKNSNSITCIHGNKVNGFTKWNLLSDILNPLKRTKSLNSIYYPIIQGCINTRKGKLKFKSSQILLDSGCSSWL